MAKKKRKRNPLPPPEADYPNCYVVGPLTRGKRGQGMLPVICKRCPPEQAIVRLVPYTTEFISRGGTLCKQCGQRSNLKHGMSDTKEYNAWVSLRWRAKNHPLYVGKGRGYDPAWDSFPTFFRDMGPCPPGKSSLGRIDNRLGYGYVTLPNGDRVLNCQWEDSIEQANNTDQNRHIDVNGQPLTIAQAAEALGVDEIKLRYQVSPNQGGRTLDEALKILRAHESAVYHLRPNAPDRKTGVYVSVPCPSEDDPDGSRRMLLIDAARHYGVDYGRLYYYHVVSGQPLETAVTLTRKERAIPRVTKAMAREHGVALTQLRYQMTQGGRTLADALRVIKSGKRAARPSRPMPKRARVVTYQGQDIQLSVLANQEQLRYRRLLYLVSRGMNADAAVERMRRDAASLLASREVEAAK